MKIAIPVDSRAEETNVSLSFGRAPYFLIYDTATGESVFMENSAASSEGGAGIKAAQNIVDSGAGALITPRCGENAARVLKAAGIKLFKNFNFSVKDNLKAIQDEKLEFLDEIHPGFHRHGGNR